MPSNKVQGIIEIKQNIAKEMATAQSSTRDYMKTLREMEKDLEKLKKAKVKAGDWDMSDVREAEEEIERLKGAVRGVSREKGRAQIDADTSEAVSKVGDLKSTIAKAAATIGVTALIKTAITDGIDYNAATEQSQISWETILGDTTAAEQRIQDLVDMAAHTPFEFAGLDSAAKKLTMAGFAGEELNNALLSVGDTVSAIGGGQEELDGISTALFQIYTKGKLSAEEMLQLAERGLPAWEILADKMGVSMADLQKMTQDGKVMANEVLPLLIEGMGERFGGAMEKQSKSMVGMKSTAKDLYNQFMADTTGSMFDTLKGAIGDLNSEMGKSHMQRYAREIGAALGAATKGVINLAKGLWDNREAVVAAAAGFATYKAVTAAGSFIDGMVASFKALRTATQAADAAQRGLNAAQAASPWGAAALAISAIVSGFTLLAQHAAEVEAPLTEAREAIEEIGASYEEAMDAAKESYRSQISDMQMMREQVDTIDRMIQDGADSRQIDLAIDNLLNQFPELEDAITKVNGKWEIQKKKVDEVADSVIRAARLEQAQSELEIAALARDTAAKDVEEKKAERNAYIQENREDYDNYVKAINDFGIAESNLSLASAQQAAAQEAYGKNPNKETGDKLDEANMAQASAQAQMNTAFSNLYGGDHDQIKKQLDVYNQGIAELETELASREANLQRETDEFNAIITGQGAPEEEITETAAPSIYTSEIFSTLESDLKPIIDTINTAYGELEKGNVQSALQYAKDNGLSISEDEIKKAGSNAAAAAKLLEEALQEAARETLNNTRIAADTQLDEYGKEMSTLERQGLSEYAGTIKDALNSSSKTAGDSMAEAIGWLRGWKLPIDITVTTRSNGTTTYTSATGASQTTSAPQENAVGDPYFEGGLTWVGENGPELMSLPKGTEITPAWRTEDKLRETADSGVKNITVNVNISGVNASDPDDVNGMINQLVDALQKAV